jgi:pimeloyl-ACP methyl ester carboxylesterase
VKPAELHFTDSGGRGEAVVLVHAIGCDLGMWESLGQALAPLHRVIRVDVRGHGASPVPPRPTRSTSSPTTSPRCSNASASAGRTGWDYRWAA